MFNRKSNEIKRLTTEIREINRKNYNYAKENINDFILILEQIQATNNEQLQWKKKQKTINNAIDLAIQDYKNKIVELDIDNN